MSIWDECFHLWFLCNSVMLQFLIQYLNAVLIRYHCHHVLMLSTAIFEKYIFVMIYFKTWHPVFAPVLNNSESTCAFGWDDIATRSADYAIHVRVYVQLYIQYIDCENIMTKLFRARGSLYTYFCIHICMYPTLTKKMFEKSHFPWKVTLFPDVKSTWFRYLYISCVEQQLPSKHPLFRDAHYPTNNQGSFFGITKFFSSKTVSSRAKYPCL